MTKHAAFSLMVHHSYPYIITPLYHPWEFSKFSFYFFLNGSVVNLGFLGVSSGKELACLCRRRKRHGFDPWVRKILWRRAWQPTPGFLPREFHRQRSLVGYSPWG